MMMTIEHCFKRLDRLRDKIHMEIEYQTELNKDLITLQLFGLMIIRNKNK